jgi:hypothetical protein
MMPPPRPLPAGPSVTEVRTPDGTPVQTTPGFGYPAGPTMGVPVGPGGGLPTYGPSVGPYPGQPGDPGLAVGPGSVDPSGDCAVPACNPADRIRSCNHWYASAEYLMWWTRSIQTPTLLTTSSPGFNGILGTGNTIPVYGGSGIGDSFHNGGRFALGRWFCDDPKWGVEARFWFLGQGDSTYTATSNQFPVLARPFFNVNTPFGQFAEVIASPGLSIGSATVKTSTSLWGADANLMRMLYRTDSLQLYGLVGYRYMYLNEQLAIGESFARTPGSDMAIGTPAVFGQVSDVFRTVDQFNGGQIGLGSTFQRGRWFVNGRATVAFGAVEQTAIISGSQSLVFPGGAVGGYHGGLLALPGANIGTWHHYQFAVLPDVNLNIGYQLTSRMRIFAGYNFLYLGNALRPGGAIDTAVDAARIPNFPLPGSPAILPGAPRPGPYFHTNDFFAQGINFGLQFNW